MQVWKRIIEKNLNISVALDNGQGNLSNMENNSITIELEKIFKEKEKDTSDSFLLLKEANDKYNLLVKSGVIKKRGYTLKGIEDTFSFNISLNGY
jgi:hypothetical protein